MEFLFYMGDVFTPINFGLLLLGTIGGLILGATPGLSPTMAVALLIPFTFKLEPQQGLILLGAAYTSTVAGGAVSAILLKIPGAPANIATTLDGHTMALKGEGAKALQVSFLASAVGGLFGVFLLIFLTPVLAQWALAFGPSHLFWLAILGVTVIGTLDSSSVVKGLLSGCIGLWLATIGFDDIMGAQRFIFHPSVSGGINVIPALIGLFAIPQVITMFTKGRSRREVWHRPPRGRDRGGKRQQRHGRPLAGAAADPVDPRLAHGGGAFGRAADPWHFPRPRSVHQLPSGGLDLHR